MEYSVSEDSEGSEIENSYQVIYLKFCQILIFLTFFLLKERSANGYPICRGCVKEIYDKYYLRVNDASWHEECLKCNYCSLTLVSEETCFIKKNKIFCKLDYYK